MPPSLKFDFGVTFIRDIVLHRRSRRPLFEKKTDLCSMQEEMTIVAVISRLITQAASSRDETRRGSPSTNVCTGGRLGPDIHDAATSCGRLALQCRSPCKAAPALELRPPASTADGIRPLWSRLSTRPRKRSAAFILLLLLSRSYILYHRFLINSSRSEPVSRLITYPAFRFFVFHPISTRLIELTSCNFTFILTNR